MSARSERFEELDRLIAEGKGDQPTLPATRHTLNFFRHEAYAAKMRQGLTPNTRHRKLQPAKDIPLPTPARLLVTEIAKSYGFSTEEVLARGKQPRYSLVRAACYVALQEKLRLSLPEIGRLFRRHPTTILDAIVKYKGEVADSAGSVRIPDRGKLIRLSLDKITEGVAELRALLGGREAL